MSPIKRDSVNKWLELTHDSGNVGMYRFTKGGNATLLSSCFSLFIQELLDQTQLITTTEQEKWVLYLKERQDSRTGLFQDPMLKATDLKDDLHSAVYLEWQMTMFGISALDVFGEQPKYNLKFLNKFRGKELLQAWLADRDLSNPWMMSNEIMFLMFFFSYEYIQINMRESLELLEIIFNYLDQHIDSKTGLWGTNYGANTHNAMAGAYHFYPFYAYFKRSIMYPENVIDRVLALQNRCDGLFLAKGGGGACEDLDAIYILTTLGRRTGYRKEDILIALSKAEQGIIQNQNADGGFSWAKFVRYGIKEWYYALNPIIPNMDWRTIFVLKKSAIGSRIKRTKSLSHAGWDKMTFDIEESDMWSTYFRLFALSLIDEYRSNTGENQWKYRSIPGIGWFK